MSQHDLDNMTVVALKRELKAKNLPMTGNKNDLVQRLSTYLTSHDDQPSDSKVHDFAIGSSTATDVLTEVSHADTTKISAMIASSASLETEIRTCTKPSTENVKHSSDIQAASHTLPIARPVGNENLADKHIPNDTKDATDKIDVKPTTLSEDERRILRAKKFNIPVILTKEMRAERFGLNQSKSINKSDFSKSSVVVSADALKKRAERFGLSEDSKQQSFAKSGVQDVEKLRQRSLRFGLTDSDNGKKGTDNEKVSEVLLKRKERFGDDTNSKAIEDSLSDKKRMRAERFGLKC